MPAYWIAHVTIHDEQPYQEYMALASIAFKKYNAKFIARTENAYSFEGTAFKKHVVIEFANIETAQACYHSQEYQNARKKREHAADAMITIIDGIDLAKLGTDQ